MSQSEPSFNCKRKLIDHITGLSFFLLILKNFPSGLPI